MGILLTDKENEIIIHIAKRLLNTTGNKIIYTYGLNIDFNDLYLNSLINEIDESKQYRDEIICLYKCDNNCETIDRIENRYKNDNSIICISEGNIKEGYSLDYIDSKRRITLIGKYFEIDNIKVKDEFKVLAIVHAYNEEDVIGETIAYLLQQGIDVYVVDNWSTDNTNIIVEKYRNKNPKHVFYERFPLNQPNEYYDWYHQLERTEEISKELNYNWYIHYDADEMRITPWNNTTLRQMIYYADLMGCNLIENTVIDFKITDSKEESIFMKDTWFDFGRREAHFLQTKTWKKNLTIDLKSTGGHVAIIDNPRMFPLKILNRHYPFRSLSQAEKKIFIERKPRFSKEQQERGWHGHYDNLKDVIEIVQDKEKLYLWSINTIKDLYIPLFTGAGINKENIETTDWLNIEIDNNSIIILYAAGKFGEKIYKKLCNKHIISHWVDKDYKRKGFIYGREIESPRCIIRNENYDYILIAIKDKNISKTVAKEILSMGIKETHILYI